MSTDHQQYSTENQAAAIAAYAEERGYEVIQTYQDKGISGLSLRGRAGLRRLIADAVSGCAEYSTVLVYDVSRWGRFQDPDQSAHYEFICREAGVQVEYCAEAFDNDGSLASIILKQMRRAMAADFSRDLADKVRVGKFRMAARGFWQGGPPGYGLRRMLVDSDGTPLGVLRRGDHKALHGQRIVIVLGPPDEQAVVRRIYADYIERRISRPGIAAALNEEGVPPPYGRPWTEALIRFILTREIYAGDLVYNRTTGILGGARRPSSPDVWVRLAGAVEPMVSRETWEEARRICRARDTRGSRDELLSSLRDLYADLGYLTARDIDRTPHLRNWRQHPTWLARG